MISIAEKMNLAMDDLVEQAADCAVEYDMQELQAFASRLRGLGDTENDDEAMALLPGVHLPMGFFHARYTIYEVKGRGTNGELLLAPPKPAGELITGWGDPLDLTSLVRFASILASSYTATSTGPGRWLESFALPIKNPGMFELALVVEPREINDGSFSARIDAEIRMVKARTARDRAAEENRIKRSCS